ncbi:hypothetical protein BDZ89DRAFT_1145997 [Hymenopellis radicata]|nr:hypothetical protein BDZ89DRAFT_1145997 [Hymenopellis radicata]
MVAATGVVLTSDHLKQKLPIYPIQTPEISLQETPSTLEKQIGQVWKTITQTYGDAHVQTASSNSFHPRSPLLRAFSTSLALPSVALFLHACGRVAYSPSDGARSRDLRHGILSLRQLSRSLQVDCCSIRLRLLLGIHTRPARRKTISSNRRVHRLDSRPAKHAVSSLGYHFDQLIDSSSPWTCSKATCILRTTALELSSHGLATTLSMMTLPR